MLSEVEVKQVDPRPTAIVRRRTSQNQLSVVIPQACGEVWQFVRANNIPNPGFNLAVYLDMEMNLEVGVTVLQPFTSTGPVICSSTPGGTVATVAYFGSYRGLGEAHDAVQAWVKAKGYRLAGPSWEIYDHWNDDESKLRTDVFYLLADGEPSG